MEEAMRKGGGFEAKELVNLHWLEKNLAKDGIDCGDPFEYEGRTLVIFSVLAPDGTVKASFYDIGPAREKFDRDSYTPSEPEVARVAPQPEKAAVPTPPVEDSLVLDIEQFWKELETAEAVAPAHHTESSVMGLSAPVTAAETRVAAELTADDASAEPAVRDEEASTETAEAASRNEGFLSEVVSGAIAEQSPAVVQKQEVVTQFTEAAISAPVETRSEQAASVQPEASPAESVEAAPVAAEKAIVIENTTEAEPVVQTAETATAEVATAVKPEVAEVGVDAKAKTEVETSESNAAATEVRIEAAPDAETEESRDQRTEIQEVGPRPNKIEELVLRSLGAKSETLRRYYAETRKTGQPSFVPVAEERRREIILEEDPESGIKLVQVA